MLNQLSGIIVFALFVVISFTACDSDLSKEVRMEIDQISILSVSEDRPAEVLIGVVGPGSNRCPNLEANVDADRKGGTIRLSATMDVPTGIVDCVAPIITVYGEVAVGNLEVGTYKVVQDDRELLHFHIAADAGYVYLGPVIECIDVSMKTRDGVEQVGSSVETSDPVHVTISVKGYFNSECMHYLKTHMYRDEFPGRWKIVYVDISGDVPIINTQCALPIDPYQNPVDSPDDAYSNVIDLGTFSAGDYKVIVNGKSTWFSIKSTDADEVGQDG